MATTRDDVVEGVDCGVVAVVCAGLVVELVDDMDAASRSPVSGAGHQGEMRIKLLSALLAGVLSGCLGCSDAHGGGAGALPECGGELAGFSHRNVEVDGIRLQPRNRGWSVRCGRVGLASDPRPSTDAGQPNRVGYDQRDGPLAQ